MEKTASSKISSWKIAATYIGTVVGAGFASGQEVLQFFGYFRFWGILSLLITSFLFYYFGKLILGLGKELKAESHLPIINYAGGKWLGKFIDYVIIFFLFGALTAMVAGAGSIMEEQLNMSAFLGNGIMVIATLVTVLAGISGVISAISFVVPILLLAVFGISIYAIYSAGFTFIPVALPGSPAVPFWPLASLVYVSYNLVMAVAILGPLGMEAKNNRAVINGAFWGGIGLGFGALAILSAILVTLPQSARYDIPMIYIAGQISPLVQRIYSFILFAEIYTTAVGSLYGFVARLVSPKNVKVSRLVAIASSVCAMLASQVGFTNIVRTLYPVVGYAGLLMLGGLLYHRIISKTQVLVPVLKRPKKEE